MADATATITVNTEVVPAEPDPVTKGLQTWAGYGSAAAAFLLAVVTFVLTQESSYNLPPYVQLGLLALAAGLTAITGRNRSDQARANTEAATRVAVAALAPADLPAALRGSQRAAVGADVPAVAVLDGLPAPDAPDALS